MKDNSLITTSFVNNESKNSIQYIFKSLGRIIVEPQNGKLTILERTNEVINENNEEDKVIIPPYTDIDFSFENNTQINSYILFFDEKKKYRVY